MIENTGKKDAARLLVWNRK